MYITILVIFIFSIFIVFIVKKNIASISKKVSKNANVKFKRVILKVIDGHGGKIDFLSLSDIFIKQSNDEEKKKFLKEILEKMESEGLIFIADGIIYRTPRKN